MIWIPDRLLDELNLLASASFPKETGGVFIGYDAGNGLVVTAITGPGPMAVHVPYAFTPDYNYQDAMIEHIYHESGRCHTYLGDWHTHPVGSTALSSKDRRTLLTIARHRPARIAAPIMGILAGSDPWRLAVWRCFPRDLRSRRFLNRFEELKLCREQLDTVPVDWPGPVVAS